jgi:hypothetical protein
MNDQEKKADSVGEELKPEPELSPADKLANKNPEESPIPGAQNPASEEIKKEINPNTE